MSSAPNKCGILLKNGTRIVHGAGAPSRDAFPPALGISGRLQTFSSGNANEPSTPCFCGPHDLLPFDTETRMPRHVQMAPAPAANDPSRPASFCSVSRPRTARHYSSQQRHRSRESSEQQPRRLPPPHHPPPCVAPTSRAIASLLSCKSTAIMGAEPDGGGAEDGDAAAFASNSASVTSWDVERVEHGAGARLHAVA
ncbi:hypothetical protein BDV19DRAFT_388228 [Aspergillus venezuelensis]